MRINKNPGKKTRRSSGLPLDMTMPPLTAVLDIAGELERRQVHHHADPDPRTDIGRAGGEIAESAGKGETVTLLLSSSGRTSILRSP